MFDKDAIKAIALSEAITAANEAVHVPGVTALPNDYTAHDFERYMTNRRRARGTLTTSALADFAEYAKTHAEAGAVVFIDQDKMQAVAVLNLGDPKLPGFADNRAVLAPKKTAAYLALQRHATGQGLTQKAAAEFLEDWQGHVECCNAQGTVSTAQAIAAVRLLTVEALKRLESAEQSLSAAKSTFESVKASSVEPIPTTINFCCVPFHGLGQRVFVLRLGILTGGEKPAVGLRVQKQEEHDEAMAEELANCVRDAVGMELPVLIGHYLVAA